ncbi:MAG: hypothetical protein K1Y36_12305 [Blastocatellia bacterium]|nr:hypothetical protein [Blastocatellia bacterium]
MFTQEEANQMAVIDFIQILLVGQSIARLTIAFPMADAVFQFDRGILRGVRFGNLGGLPALHYALVVDACCPKVVKVENLSEITETGAPAYTIDDVKFMFERLQAAQADYETEAD